MKQRQLKQIKSPQQPIKGLYPQKMQQFFSKTDYYRQGSVAERENKFFNAFHEAIRTNDESSVKFLLSTITEHADIYKFRIFTRTDENDFTLLGFADLACRYYEAQKQSDEYKAAQDVLALIYINTNCKITSIFHQESETQYVLMSTDKMGEIEVYLQDYLPRMRFDFCRHSMYHGLIENNAKRMKAGCKMIGAAAYRLEPRNDADLVAWFGNAILFEKDLPVLSGGKKAHHLLVDYVSSLKPTDERYKSWIKNLESHRDWFVEKSLLDHPLIKKFLSSSVTPEFVAEFEKSEEPSQSAQPQEPKKTKKKKAKKTAAQAPSISIVLETVEQKEVETRESHDASQLTPIEVSSALLLLMTDEMKKIAEESFSALGKQFREIVCLLAALDENNIYSKYYFRLQQIKAFEESTGRIFTAGCVTLLSAEELNHCWLFALREFSLHAEKFIVNPNLTPEEQNEAVFACAVAGCVDFDIESMPVVPELQKLLTQHFSPCYPDLDLWLVGSVTTQLVRRTFSPVAGPFKIDHDIDLVLLLGSEGIEITYLIFSVAKLLGVDEKEFSVKWAEHNQPHLTTLKFKYLGVPVDIVIYSNRQARPLPVSSRKGFEFSLTHRMLVSPADYLFKWLRGEESYNVDALHDTTVLAFVFRELARPDSTISFDEIFKKKFTDFIKDEKNRVRIAKAIALMLTKYTNNCQSPYFIYFLQHGFFGFPSLLNNLNLDQKKRDFIKVFITEALKIFPTIEGCNFLPITLLAVGYITSYHKVLLENLSLLDQEPFLPAVREKAKIFIQAFHAHKVKSREFVMREEDKIYLEVTRNLVQLTAQQAPTIIPGLSVWKSVTKPRVLNDETLDVKSRPTTGNFQQ